MNYRRYWLVATFLLLLWPVESWAQAGVAEMNTWIEGKLAVDNSSLTAYFFLFLGGILASLLPCVYPLYPITAHVIKARGDTSARWIHPLTYFLGLASMSFVFGVIASVSGGAFNLLMRYPLTNLSIGLLIIIMGIASAGLLHIPLFGGQADTNKKGRKVLWTGT